MSLALSCLSQLITYLLRTQPLQITLSLPLNILLTNRVRMEDFDDSAEPESYFVFSCNFNPLLPIAHKSAQIDKISILKLEGIIKKISYERRDYESVDEKSLSKAVSKNYEKENSGTKGLNQTNFFLPWTKMN